MRVSTHRGRAFISKAFHRKCLACSESSEKRPIIAQMKCKLPAIMIGHDKSALPCSHASSIHALAGGAAACLVRRQRGLPLSRAVLRRAALPAVGVLGVAWLRIASAALVFAPVTRPWRTFGCADRRDAAAARRARRLPGGHECVVLSGARPAAARRWSRRSNSSARSASRSTACAAAAISLALAIAVAGVFILIDVSWSSDRSACSGPCSTARCSSATSCSATGSRRGRAADGIDRLGAAMVVALLFALPIGFAERWPPSPSPLLCRRNRRRHLLIGHSLCLRPARHVAAAARDLRADAGAAAGHRHADRRRSCWRRSRASSN